jgi:hypothetical protein
MRVLHVIPSIGPARGGPSVVIHTMTRCQAEQGLVVHVATTDDNGSSRLANSEHRPKREGKVTYWIFPRQSRLYTFSFPLTCWLWAHAKDYDVIHIHALFSYPSVVAAICAALAHVPYVVRPLGTLSRWGMLNRRRRLKKLSFRRATNVSSSRTQSICPNRRLGRESSGPFTRNWLVRPSCCSSLGSTGKRAWTSSFPLLLLSDKVFH